ncbi:LytR/AlgR family response regulator transcription factor, partial [Acinetobacter baumannii]|uniref:LytR/AlgR family response regulator transcription factor n=1 Tax=Acinetobacter baumannii TaxID=470 RepID=UPI00280DBF79
MKVLICDDEPLAVERLSRLVSKMGHEVVATAHHGQDALEQARLHHPDVILLDIQMPGMNGLVCAEQLSQLIVKLLYYSYKIRKKLEITHRLSRST